jgi:chloride channel protein, CIC family
VQSDDNHRRFDAELNHGPAAEDPVNGGRLAVLPTGESVITPPAQFRMLLISILAAGVGTVAGCIAFLLYKLIGLFTNLFFFHRFATDFSSARHNHLGLWVIVIPVIGGIIVGFMAKYGSPKIRGHGIPEAIEAVLANRSRIEPRVALLKPISTAIAIGTGGPFGAEGPIIQTGGAIGSLIGQVLQVTASERKVLLACGAAAGMSAAFNTPIAGVILAIELLLFEFKSRSFIPLVIASTLATEVHVRLLGRGPMFSVGPVDFGATRALPFYLLLGIICGLAAVGFSKSLYWVEDQFEKLPINELWCPAIGALGVGIIGYFVPRVLGVGYDTTGDILNANLGLKLLVIVMVAKAAALVVSLGSGSSGGLLAPMFMSSAAMGGAYAVVIDRIYPGAQLAAGAFALVAMGAVFGAASRATFTFIIFAFEVTRDYKAVLPLMLVSVIADGIAMLLMPKSSVMTEKLVRHGMRIPTDYETDVLEQVSVEEMMDRELPTISSETSVAELADKIARRDPLISKHLGLLILDADGNLEGVITRSDILRAFEKGGEGRMSVLDAGTRDLVVTYPDESVQDAAAKMLRHNIGRLPVVERREPARVLGYLGRQGVMAARLRRLDEEHVREPGWARRFSRRPAL